MKMLNPSTIPENGIRVLIAGCAYPIIKYGPGEDNVQVLVEISGQKQWIRKRVLREIADDENLP